MTVIFFTEKRRLICLKAIKAVAAGKTSKKDALQIVEKYATREIHENIVTLFNADNISRAVKLLANR